MPAMFYVTGHVSETCETRPGTGVQRAGRASLSDSCSGRGATSTHEAVSMRHDDPVKVVHLYRGSWQSTSVCRMVATL